MSQQQHNGDHNQNQQHGQTPPPPPPTGGHAPMPGGQTPNPGSVPPPPNPMTGAGFPPPPPAGGKRPPFMPPRPKPKVDNTPFTFGEIWKGYEFKITLPEHKTQFDEMLFVRLLSGSISLTKNEKRKIIESIPRLSQRQIDELINILTDEKAKFIELSEKHKTQLRKLEKQHFEDWKDLEMRYEMDKRQTEDDAKADEIRKKLGL